MAQFNIADAKAHFSELVERALAGEEVIVARDDKPLVKLVPLGNRGSKRTPGSAHGHVWMSADLDDPLPDFDHYK